MNTLQRLGDRELIKKMTSDGFLRDWTKHKCPYCKCGCIMPLKKWKGSTGDWVYRCRKKGCQRFIYPHACHPVFKLADGKSHKPLRDQFRTLFGIVIGLSIGQNHLLWEDSKNFISDMSKRLDIAREKYVLKRERQIKFGDPLGKQWRDVEADEVDLGKEFVGDDGQTVEWQQWAGIVERGRPSSLVLFRTNCKRTSVRAPGPGPIKKRDWRPAAQKWLKDRNILLHTDGAKSYRIGMNRNDQMPGIVHDYVVHKMKKRGDGKKMKARYVQLFSHCINGKTIHAKGGTQIIDRCWVHIRKHINKRSTAKGGQRRYNSRVRSAQWTYWNMGKDLFEETGRMLCSV